MNNEVIIFGAGIAGLTAAHELAKLGYKITIFERMNNVGGFARSDRLFNDAPTEHSWRGYAPFYYNFFDIAKEIPLDETNRKTVFDNLSKPINFLLPRDKIGKKLGEPKLTISDMIKLANGVAPALLSGNKRNQYYAGVNFKGDVGNSLSKGGQEKILGMIGPGLGLNLYDVSTYHIAKAVELMYSARINKPFGNSSWQVMKKPTSEAWFKPWVNYLVSHFNIKIIYNSELQKILVDNNIAVGFLINIDGKSHIIANNSPYILAVDPFQLDKIIRNSDLYNYQEFNKIPDLIADGEHKQISFQIAFSEKILFNDLHGKNIDAFAFPNSEFNITLYPQDKLFDKNMIPCQFKGYWSGTACVANRAGKLFGLPAEKLTIDQFCLEIIYQITRSKELQKIIKIWNGKNFADFEILAMYVWNGWEMVCGELTEINKKWVNTTNTFQYRPSQNTPISNLFLSGAHTKTSINIWSMEGAIESGKIAAKMISKSNKIKIIEHKEDFPINIFHSLDDKLYDIGLPSVLWFISYILAIVFAYFVAKLGLGLEIII